MFAASAPLTLEAWAFLGGIPNPCVELPADGEALDALVNTRAAGLGVGLAQASAAGDAEEAAAVDSTGTAG